MKIESDPFYGSPRFTNNPVDPAFGDKLKKVVSGNETRNGFTTKAQGGVIYMDPSSWPLRADRVGQ